MARTPRRPGAKYYRQMHPRETVRLFPQVRCYWPTAEYVREFCRLNHLKE